MSEAQREPCPRCGEPAALSAKVCPFCQGSLRVDVALDAPVSDSRFRYQLSREIASLGSPAPPFSAVQQALASPRPVLARDVSRLATLRLTERLADFGLQARLEPAGTTAPAARGSRPLAAAGLGMVAVLAALLWMRPQSGGADRPALPHPARGIARTQAPSWPTPPPPLAPRDLSALARLSVARLRSGERESSGFFVAPDLVLTRSGVDAGGAVEVSLAGGRELPGEVLKRDGRLDLALVRVPEARAEPLQLGDASALKSGARVFLPSAPPAASTPRQGTVGTVARELQGVVLLGLDGDLGPADAGGPVLDAQGQVVGVAAPRQEGNFLLPINYAYQDSELVAPPRPGPNLKRWNQLLAQVETAERLRVAAPH